MEDINDQAAMFSLNNVNMSSNSLKRQEELNTRYDVQNTLVWLGLAWLGLECSFLNFE